LPIALVVAAAAVVACSDNDTSGGERVSGSVQRALPTFQYSLAEEVCPDQLGMPPDQEERTRRRGERQLEALLRAYRRGPRALVRTSYASSDEDPGIHHEEMTVAALLDTHLLTAEELASDDEEDACFRRVEEALRKAKAAA
jgi:hypothetical protein